MNQTIRNILDRVSIRSFKQEQISEEQLQTVLECGINTATAKNMQPWHLTVIQDPDKIASFVAAFGKAVDAFGDADMKANIGGGKYHNFYHAPTIIIVAGDDSNPWADVDCGALAENMSVAASAIGLGSCTIGSFKFALGTPFRDEMLKDVVIPEGYSVRLGFALGCPDGERPPRKPRDAGKISYVR